jgi:hypothetical protein
LTVPLVQIGTTLLAQPGAIGMAEWFHRDLSDHALAKDISEIKHMVGANAGPLCPAGYRQLMSSVNINQREKLFFNTQSKK